MENRKFRSGVYRGLFWHPEGGEGKEKQKGKMAHMQIGFWMLDFFPPSIFHFRNVFLVV